MRIKLYLVVAILSVYCATAQKRCNLVEIPLNERLQNASLVVEGIVRGQSSQWDDNHFRIYTIYQIEVLGILKGTTNDTTVLVACPGGTLGLKRQVASQTLELTDGATGIFTLIANNDSVSAKQMVYEPYAMSQGFIEYDRNTKTARDVFKTYKSIDDALYPLIEKATRRKIDRIKPLPWEAVKNRVIAIDDNESSNQQHRATLATISSFSPTTVQAGRNVQLTITGQRNVANGFLTDDCFDQPKFPVIQFFDQSQQPVPIIFEKPLLDRICPSTNLM